MVNHNIWAFNGRVPLKDLVKIILDYVKEDFFFYQEADQIVSVKMSDFTAVNRYDATNIMMIKYFGNGKLYFVTNGGEEIERFLVSYLSIGYYDLNSGKKVTMLMYQSESPSQTFIINYKGKIYTTNQESNIVVFDATTDRKLYDSEVGYIYKGVDPIIYQNRIYLSDGIVRVYDLDFNLLATHNLSIIILKIYQGRVYAIDSDYYARNSSLLVYDVNNFNQIDIINQNLVDPVYINIYKDTLLITDQVSNDVDSVSGYEVKKYDLKTYEYLGNVTDTFAMRNYSNINVSVIGNEICYNGDTGLVFKNILTGAERQIKTDGYILYTHQ